MTSSSFRSGNVSDDYQEESGIMDVQSIEDQMVEALDNLTAKSAKTRLVAFEVTRKALGQRCMFEFVMNRKITVLDCLSRCIKRSKGQDLGYAAHLVSIVCATLGPSPDTDPILSDIIQQLLTLLSDQTVQSEVRSKCARSIAICTFIIGVDGYIVQIMDRLFSIFSLSCAKGDGTMPNPTEQVAALHSVCIQGWTLLLTALNNLSAPVALELVEEHIDKITELLESKHLDVKISTGEAIAVMCEVIRASNKDITVDDFDELCDKLREVMTDAQKSRGKKDLRQQRSNFREILATIEEGDMPNLSVKFGRERLVLESWSRRRQYDAFCELFATGMNHHLAENEFVRDIFELGAVLVDTDMPRIKRSDNSYENMIADKARTKNMRKLRDKRAVVLN